MFFVSVFKKGSSLFKMDCKRPIPLSADMDEDAIRVHRCLAPRKNRFPHLLYTMIFSKGIALLFLFPQAEPTDVRQSQTLNEL